MKKYYKKISKHACKRMQQRGIKTKHADIIMNYSDIEIPVGKNSVAISISKPQLSNLQSDGLVSPQMSEKIKKKCLIVASDDEVMIQRDVIVSAIIIKKKEGRHYRKKCSRNYRSNKK